MAAHHNSNELSKQQSFNHHNTHNQLGHATSHNQTMMSNSQMGHTTMG